MPHIDRASQQESSNQLPPLVANYMKEHPEDKDLFFAINNFKFSKSEEWLIATEAKNRFTILVHKNSKQFAILEKLIDECKQVNTALIGVFDAKMKSNFAFGFDEETPVTWEQNPIDYARYSFKRTDNAYTSPPSTPVEEDVIPVANMTQARKRRQPA